MNGWAKERDQFRDTIELINGLLILNRAIADRSEGTCCFHTCEIMLLVKQGHEWLNGASVGHRLLQLRLDRGEAEQGTCRFSFGLWRRFLCEHHDKGRDSAFSKNCILVADGLLGNVSEHGRGIGLGGRRGRGQQHNQGSNAAGRSNRGDIFIRITRYLC